MAFIDSIYNSCIALSKKASQGMKSILKAKIYKPIRPDGIISHTDLKVTKVNSNVITIETQFPDYTPFVDKGRRKGKYPPIAPIAEWCQRHSMPNGVEYAIQRKIGIQGTKGKDFMTPLNRMLEMLTKTIKDNAKISLQAQYKQTFYDGVKTLEEIKFKM